MAKKESNNFYCDNPRIHIIGAGAFGQVLFNILSNKFQCKLLTRQEIYDINGGDLLILAIPSQSFPIVIPKIINVHKFLICSKGMVNGYFLHDIVKKFHDASEIAYLSGPNFASELAMQLPTSSVIASPNDAYNLWLKNIFGHSFWRIYCENDMLGVALCGIVKNIYAIGAGIIVGKKWGHNAHASYVSRTLIEMEKIILFLGGCSKTVYSVAGVGDLILTTGSQMSRNMQLGMMLGQGSSIENALHQINHVCEGYYATQNIYELIKNSINEFPVIQQIFQILYHEKPIDKALQDLMNR